MWTMIVLCNVNIYVDIILTKNVVIEIFNYVNSYCEYIMNIHLIANNVTIEL